jgi:hypothetical protein
MEILSGKILLMIWSGALIPWGLFHHLFLLLDFQCLDFYGGEGVDRNWRFERLRAKKTADKDFPFAVELVVRWFCFVCWPNQQRRKKRFFWWRRTMVETIGSEMLSCRGFDFGGIFSTFFQSLSTYNAWLHGCNCCNCVYILYVGKIFSYNRNIGRSNGLWLH